MKNIKPYKLFDNINYDILTFSDSDSMLCYFNKDILESIYVGEGVDDITVELDNTITIQFINNAWGGITFEEWEHLYERYKKYDIEMSSNTSERLLFIEISTQFTFDVELLNEVDFMKKLKENKTKEFNI